MKRRLALASVAAWMVLAAIVLNLFADEALPSMYLVRPLVVAAGVALVCGIVSLPARGHAVAIAAGAAALLSRPEPALILILAGILLGTELARRRGRMPTDSQLPVLALVTVFFGLGLIRAIPAVDLPTEVGYRAESGGPPMYLVLLDGYPRADTLADLGIESEGFVDALESRGFDHYSTAHSLHTRTLKTLLAMLTDASVDDEPISVAERRRIREQLVVPPGFVAVDPPIGHATLGAGPHVDPGGPNDFEAQLVGRSAIGVLAPDWAWGAFVDGLQFRIDSALSHLPTNAANRVFVHLMAPHPPFIFVGDASSDPPRWCWPTCGMFWSTIESLGVSEDRWAEAMDAQLEALNARLLETIDRLIARSPNAVIVLFSDHGGRMSEANLAEWNRSFLAARTPDYPGLFGATPRPDTIVRTLLSTYGAESQAGRVSGTMPSRDR